MRDNHRTKYSKKRYSLWYLVFLAEISRGYPDHRRQKIQGQATIWEYYENQVRRRSQGAKLQDSWVRVNIGRKRRIIEEEERWNFLLEEPKLTVKDSA